jgi:pimeloyl-ACP methyl ester carboxylesterase
VIKVAGVQLHFLEQGSGMPLVLLHGNGSSADDFEIRGILAEAAKEYRVTAFDRPGFGKSTRPRGTWWTPAAQADLIHAALRELGIERYLVLGHSWGASVALQCALRHQTSVAGVILVSGYYYPTARLDAALPALPALPVVGAVLRHTLMPLLVRLTWPFAMRKIFRPAPVSTVFASAMKEPASRASQLRSISLESGLLVPSALLTSTYKELLVPTGIIAGAGDRLLDAEAQAQRLHDEVPGSLIDVVQNSGHMVHHSVPQSVLAMLDAVAAIAQAQLSGRMNARLNFDG